MMGQDRKEEAFSDPDLRAEIKKSIAGGSRREAERPVYLRSEIGAELEKVYDEITTKKTRYLDGQELNCEIRKSLCIVIEARKATHPDRPLVGRDQARVATRHLRKRGIDAKGGELIVRVEAIADTEFVQYRNPQGKRVTKPGPRGKK
jgi:hypothetical protein